MREAQQWTGTERRWRAATALLSVLLLAALVWGALERTERVRAERMYTAQFQRALFELIAQVEQTELLMAKSLVSGSDPRRVMYLTDVWRQSFGAQASLNQLPLGAGALMRTSQLLTQAGDYAYMLARKTARGDAVSEDDWRTLGELQRQVRVIAEQLHGVLDDAARGALSWSELQRLARGRLDDGPGAFRDGFQRLELQLAEFPTLIYDGPFSDHVLQWEPKGLAGPDIDADEARRVAREFLPYDLSEDDLTDPVEVEGPVPAFRVRAMRRAGLIDVDVSKKGGHVVWMLDARPVGETNLSLDEAVQKARQFLAQRGLAAMEPTWASAAGHRAVIPFAAVEEGVVIYPDLVKVTVALDNGDIVGYEAMGYLMSHHDRTIPRPALSEEEARARVSPLLSVGRGRLALIPLETLEEVLTWEFPADLGGDPYIIYINAVTGDEERILKLLQTEEGTLVI